MMTVLRTFSAITNAVTTVNDRLPAVILSTVIDSSFDQNNVKSSDCYGIRSF